MKWVKEERGPVIPYVATNQRQQMTSTQLPLWHESVFLLTCSDAAKSDDSPQSAYVILFTFRTALPSTLRILPRIDRPAIQRRLHPADPDPDTDTASARHRVPSSMRMRIASMLSLCDSTDSDPEFGASEGARHDSTLDATRASGWYCRVDQACYVRQLRKHALQ